MTHRPVSSLLRPVKRLVKRSVDGFVDGVWNPSLIRIALWRIRHGSSASAVHLLRAKWGNGPWAVEADYLEALMTRVHIDRPHHVLECGSGLTTVVLGALAHRYAFTVISLEHDEAWAQQTRRDLERFGLSAATVVHAPLIDWGAFRWYSVPAELPDRFDLVVCDGPPGGTIGGRVGLLPVLHEQLGGATILLDDATRPGEQAVLRQWREEFDAEVTAPTGFNRGLAIVCVPEANEVGP